jgi:2-C-methyl-D-erythritol 2,4-cyclodiphosphate synthase
MPIFFHKTSFETKGVTQRYMLDNLVRTGFARSMRRFLPENQPKPCILGGVLIKNAQGFQADFDGDVICESLYHAIASVTELDLEEITQLQKREGITDSSVFLEKAVTSLGNQKLVHVVISLEGSTPKLSKDDILTIRQHLSLLLRIPITAIRLTTVYGDGLTDCSCGAGMQSIVCITTMEHISL